MSHSRSSSLSLDSSSSGQSINTTMSQDSFDMHMARPIKRTRLDEPDPEKDWARPSKRGQFPPAATNTKPESEIDKKQEEEEDESVFEVSVGSLSSYAHCDTQKGCISSNKNKEGPIDTNRSSIQMKLTLFVYRSRPFEASGI